MVEEFNRSQRVEQELQKKIAIILQHKIKDPRLHHMITVSDVKVSRDLTCAKIFVTFIQGQEKIEKNLRVLQSASSYIRFLLSKTMNLYIVPKLVFFYDPSLIEGKRISLLINNAIKNDVLLRNKKY